MLESYRRNQSLKALEARLPEGVDQVKQELASLLEEDPLNVRALLLLARCHLHADERSEARQALESLLVHDPDHATAKLDLATILAKDGAPREAIRLLTEATSVRPEIAGAWALLRECLQEEGQTEASQDAAKQFAMIKAFNDKLRAAEQAFSKADFKTADSICRQLLQLVPNEFRTLRLLARIARQFGHHEFSTSTLARCVETRPRDAELGLEYAYSLLGSRMYKEALEQCEELVGLAPELIDTYDLKAEVLFHLGQYEEAMAIYRALSEVPEKSALSLLHLGKILKTVGKAAEATACYQQVTKVDSTLGQAYWELADLKTYRFSDDEVVAMQKLLDTGDVSALDKVLIQFALGKALEDAQQYEESFQHYQEANSGYTNIRPAHYSSPSDRLMSFFTTDYFLARTEYGDDSDAPIFVVGLPRSGSTLVEQILSSHSLVDATQELDEIVSIARAVNDPNQPEHGQYPQSMENLSAAQIQGLAQRYLDFVWPLRQQAPYFVDKAPYNFHHIGLIKTLFPKAKIIDIRRNPMASGWSQFRQFFAESFPFSYDLKTIGKYYNDYIALMNHWQQVLPDQILTVQYEDLVNDLPATVNTMLEYCGLAFEDACLSFHLNTRAVATPSSEQVRQPLYNDALEHWRNYEAFLEPLKQTIKDEASQAS